MFSVGESEMDINININEIIYVHNNMIYIKTENQSKNMIYRVSEKTQIFTGYNIKKFEILDDWVYILDDGNDVNKLIKVKTDGTNKELVLGKTETFTLFDKKLYVAQNNNNIWQINIIKEIGEKESIATFRASFDDVTIDKSKKNIILIVKSLGIYMINFEKSDIIFLDKFSNGIRMNENWIEYNIGTNSEISTRLYVTQ